MTNFTFSGIYSAPSDQKSWQFVSDSEVLDKIHRWLWNTPLLRQQLHRTSEQALCSSHHSFRWRWKSYFSFISLKHGARSSVSVTLQTNKTKNLLKTTLYKGELSLILHFTKKKEKKRSLTKLLLANWNSIRTWFEHQNHTFLLLYNEWRLAICSNSKSAFSHNNDHCVATNSESQYLLNYYGLVKLCWNTK